MEALKTLALMCWRKRTDGGEWVGRARGCIGCPHGLDLPGEMFCRAPGESRAPLTLGALAEAAESGMGLAGVARFIQKTQEQEQRKQHTVAVEGAKLVLAEFRQMDLGPPPGLLAMAEGE